MARNLGQCAAASIALALAAVTCSAHADAKPESNGMRLHELYVENLTPDHRPLDATSPLHAELARHFRPFQPWRRHFGAAGSMPGAGWAILYEDPETGRH